MVIAVQPLKLNTNIGQLVLRLCRWIKLFEAPIVESEDEVNKC